MHKVKFFLLTIGVCLFMYTGMVMSKSMAPKSKHDKEQILDKPSVKTLNVNGVPFYIDLVITASVRGDEKLEHGIYLFKLKCSSDASCSLERFSLNECAANKNGITSFTPKVDTWESWSSFLEVKQLSNNELELVVFQAFERLLPAKIILTFDPAEPPFKKLKSFEGSGFIDARLWPDTNTRLEYTALHGDQSKQLDCPVFLPGIN